MVGYMVKLKQLFDLQEDFQKLVTGKEEVIVDDVHWAQYHITAMSEELGEVLKADKRWKTHRNTNYDPANKLEEIADCFITIMNIAMFSGFNDIDIAGAIVLKIEENTNKFNREKDAHNV